MKFNIGDMVEYGSGIYEVHSVRGSLITLKGIKKAAASLVVGEQSIIKIKPKIYAIRRSKEGIKNKAKIFKFEFMAVEERRVTRQNV